MTSLAEQRVTLPHVRLLAAAWFACVLAGGAWAVAAALVGRGQADVLAGALAAGVVGIAASVALLVLRPWRPRPLAQWPFVWLAGSFLRVLLTLAGTLLLYSATQFGTRSLWFAVVVVYLAALVAETRTYARSMRRFAPKDPEAGPAERCESRPPETPE